MAEPLTQRLSFPSPSLSASPLTPPTGDVPFPRHILNYIYHFDTYFSPFAALLKHLRTLLIISPRSLIPAELVIGVIYLNNTMV